MNGFAFTIDELSFPVRAEGRLAANQDSENRFGNMANISARAEIPQQGGSPWDAVSYKKRRAASRRHHIRIGSAE